MMADLNRFDERESAKTDEASERLISDGML